MVFPSGRREFLKTVAALTAKELLIPKPIKILDGLKIPEVHAQETDTPEIDYEEVQKLLEQRRIFYEYLSDDFSPAEKSMEINKEHKELYISFSKILGKYFVKGAMGSGGTKNDSWLDDLFALAKTALGKNPLEEGLEKDLIKDGVERLDRMGALNSLVNLFENEPYTSISSDLKKMSEYVGFEEDYLERGDLSSLENVRRKEAILWNNIGLELEDVEMDIEKLKSANWPILSGNAKIERFKMSKGQNEKISINLPKGFENLEVSTELVQSGILGKVGLRNFGYSINIKVKGDYDETIAEGTNYITDVAHSIKFYGLTYKPKNMTVNLTCESTGWLASDVDVRVYVTPLVISGYSAEEANVGVRDYLQSRVNVLRKADQIEKIGRSINYEFAEN